MVLGAEIGGDDFLIAADRIRGVPRENAAVAEHERFRRRNSLNTISMSCSMKTTVIFCFSQSSLTLPGSAASALGSPCRRSVNTN